MSKKTGREPLGGRVKASLIRNSDDNSYQEGWDAVRQEQMVSDSQRGKAVDDACRDVRESMFHSFSYAPSLTGAGGADSDEDAEPARKNTCVSVFAPAPAAGACAPCLWCVCVCVCVCVGGGFCVPTCARCCTVAPRGTLASLPTAVPRRHGACCRDACRRRGPAVLTSLRRPAIVVPCPDTRRWRG